jgi:hypothetical protein
MRSAWFRLRYPREPRYSDEELAYMLWVKTLPCCCPGPCLGGPMEAHHAGRHPLGRKCGVDECVPLAMECHRGFDNASAPFKGMDHDARRAWAEKAISETQAKHAARSTTVDTIPW